MDLARIAVGVTLFSVVIFVTAREWREVSDTVVEIGPLYSTAALAVAAAGLCASAMTWRCAVVELGAHVSVSAAMKVYLVGQLGKYIPGSVWALIIQMELARAAAVRRAQSFGAGVIALGIILVTGSALAIAALPLVGSGSSWRYGASAVGLVLCSIAIAPPVLGRIVDLGLRITHRPPLVRRPKWHGIVKAAAFSATSWACYGLALGLLAIGAGAESSETLRLAVPAVALAMTAGVLVAVAPSGIGVREAVLVATLGPVLDPATALAVALVFRLVTTLADLVAALVSLPIRIGTADLATPADQTF